MTKKYQRTAEAAVAETSSKFKLAEALLLDIPTRTQGTRTDLSDDPTVKELLAEASQAIIDAGGEPRAVDTLGQYRKTAMWVVGDLVPNGTKFRWVPGVSFYAHRTAMQAGLSYEDFAALDNPTGDSVRTAAGKSSNRGTKYFLSTLSDEDRRTVAAEVLPEAAAIIAEDPLAARKLLNQAPEAAAKMAEAVQVEQINMMGGRTAKRGWKDPNLPGVPDWEGAVARLHTAALDMQRAWPQLSEEYKWDTSHPARAHNRRLIEQTIDILNSMLPSIDVPDDISSITH
jgi:hypothetical protein